MEQRLCLFAQRSASLSINLQWKSTGAQDQPAVCSVFRSSSVGFLEDKPVLTISYLFILIFFKEVQRDDIIFPSLPLGLSRVLAPLLLSRRAARAASSQSLPGPSRS